MKTFITNTIKTTTLIITTIVILTLLATFSTVKAQSLDDIIIRSAGTEDKIIVRGYVEAMYLDTLKPALVDIRNLKPSDLNNSNNFRKSTDPQKNVKLFTEVYNSDMTNVALMLFNPMTYYSQGIQITNRDIIDNIRFFLKEALKDGMYKVNTNYTLLHNLAIIDRLVSYLMESDPTFEKKNKKLINNATESWKKLYYQTFLYGETASGLSVMIDTTKLSKGDIDKINKDLYALYYALLKHTNPY